MKKKDLSGHIFLITGPSGNLGSAVVEKLKNTGASLVLVDRKPDRLKLLYSEIAGSNDHLLIPGIELTDRSAVHQAVEKTIRVFGEIHCLIHTAGGFRMGEQVHEITSTDWDLMMDINVHSFLHISQAVIPHMIKQKDGLIITIGARPALEGKKKMGAYSASKAALLRLTESIAAELKETGIQANCLIPGTIDTPENREAMPNADRSQWISPESLANLILNTYISRNPLESKVIIQAREKQ
jgi:NAD(P)-dependent dehydrogenase (short-subunit alcohol dehydrogenase family)